MNKKETIFRTIMEPSGAGVVANNAATAQQYAFIMNDTSIAGSSIYGGSLYHQRITDYATENETIGMLYQHLIFDGETGQTTQIGLNQGYVFHMDYGKVKPGVLDYPYVGNVRI